MGEGEAGVAESQELVGIGVIIDEEGNGNRKYESYEDIKGI